jgi:hypothetical protein
MDVEGKAGNDLVKVAMFDSQLTQLFDVAEQFAIDVVFAVFRHAVSLIQARMQRLDSFR